MPGLNKIYRHFNSSIYAFYYLYKLYKYNKNSFLDSSELRKIQLEEFKKVLWYAYNKVSYYKKIFDEVGIKPNNINSLQDLIKIPITSRKDIQGLSRQEIITRNTDIYKCAKLRTSGSTGIPLDILIDGQDILIRRLLSMRMHFADGRKIKDKVAIITTPQHFLCKMWCQPIQYKLRFLREKYISIFESQDNILKMINHYQPDIIMGYCSIVK
jgi:phenylacetate-CoA ligase